MYYLTVHGLCPMRRSESHCTDMINGWSCLYKSWSERSVCQTLFSLLHPSLRSMFPWVIVQCNQHIVAVYLPSALCWMMMFCRSQTLLAVKASVNSAACLANLINEIWSLRSSLSAASPRRHVSLVDARLFFNDGIKCFHQFMNQLMINVGATDRVNWLNDTRVIAWVY